MPLQNIKSLVSHGRVMVAFRLSDGYWEHYWTFWLLHTNVAFSKLCLWEEEQVLLFLFCLLVWMTFLIRPNKGLRWATWNDKLLQRGKVKGITLFYYGRGATRGLFNQRVLILVCEELRRKWWRPAVPQNHWGPNKDKWLGQQYQGASAGSKDIRYFTPVI